MASEWWMTAGDIAWGTGLFLTCLLGVLLTLIRLPGTWLIVAAAALHGWHDQWARVTGTMVLVLLGIALVAEVLETVMSVLAVQRVGASRRAAFGGFIGGFAGMLLFSLPMPLVGTIFGALLGCFLGALAGEMLARQNLNKATKAGLMSAAGFAFGAMLKTAAALAMSGLVLSAVLWPTRDAPPVEHSAGNPE